MKNIDESRLRKMVDIAITVAGSQKAFAETVGVSQQYLTDILRGRRDLGSAKKILKWFGLERVVYFRRVDGGQL